MRHKKLSIAIALVAAASTALLAGCSASSSSGGSTAKTLNLSLSGAPASLDFAQFGTGTNPLLMSMLYDRLAYQEPNGTIKPQAATGWKYSQSDTVLTVSLRSGMKFSNGDAVTAADVKATINRQIATKTNPQSAMFTQISSVDAPNATTVVIHLSAADPNLINDLSSAVGLIGDPKTFQREEHRDRSGRLGAVHDGCVGDRARHQVRAQEELELLECCGLPVLDRERFGHHRPDGYFQRPALRAA